MKKSAFQKTGKVLDREPVSVFYNTNSNKKGVYPAVFAGRVSPFRFSVPGDFQPYLIHGRVMGFAHPGKIK